MVKELLVFCSSRGGNNTTPSRDRNIGRSCKYSFPCLIACLFTSSAGGNTCVKKKNDEPKKKKAKSQQPYPHHIQQTSPKKGIPAKVKIPVNILHQNRWTERPQNRPSSDALKKFPFDPSTPRKPRKTKKNQAP